MVSNKFGTYAGDGEIDSAMQQFGPFLQVHAAALIVQVAKVLLGHLIREAAQVAAEPPAAVDKLHKRVDVGLAAGE